MAVLTGCVTSGYKAFYEPAPGATPEAIAAGRAAPPPVEPLVERSAPGNAEDILPGYFKRGYSVIGTSMFNSGHSENITDAIAQAKKVGADLVLVFTPQHTETIQSAIPLTLPTTTTSYTSGSATAYGAGGPVTAYGNATTTTYGSKTTYIPTTIRRMDFGAVYFVKQRVTFGAHTRDLNDDERQALETNQGAVVTIVIDDTPAFRADVLPGDLIYAIDGERVTNAAGYGSVINSHRGKLTTFTIIRKGSRIEKRVQL